jgi:hypothetical protein
VTRVLHALGAVLLIAGLITSLLATRAMLGDDDYYRKAAALERHADNVLFEAEYNMALSRHAAYVGTAVVSGAAGIVGGAILFALGSILARVHRLEERAAR